jgi:hypothetical protein
MIGLCWAVLGAIFSAYWFVSSTLPVTTSGEPTMWGPDWLGGIVFVATLFLGLPWLLVPVVLLIVALRRRRRWPAAWIGTIVAGIVLGALTVSGFGTRLIPPPYTGPALVSWIQLAESAGFVVIAVTITRTVLGSARANGHRANGGPADP